MTGYAYERVHVVDFAAVRPSEGRGRLGRCVDSVPQLLRYCGGVRLPAVVHHRRVSLDFPVRSATRVAGNRRISRFPCEMCRCVRVVSDRAGSRRVSRWRHGGCGLPPSSTASAPRSGHGSRRGSCISRLNTWPARPPVNASPSPMRATVHDSGPVGVATPLPYDSFIHYISPV